MYSLFKICTRAGAFGAILVFGGNLEINKVTCEQKYMFGKTRCSLLKKGATKSSFQRDPMLLFEIMNADRAAHECLLFGASTAKKRTP